MARVIGGGDFGNHLDVPCWPDSTLKTEIDALILLGTAVEGSKLVSLTWSNNYEVTSPADGAIPDGRIIKVEKDATNGYLLTVRLWSYIDQNSARHSPTQVVTLPYTTGAAPALQDSVVINSTTYMAVKDGTSGGFGAVISLNTTNETVDVIF